MPLELGELCAVRKVPDDDGGVAAPDASRPPSSATRLQTGRVWPWSLKSCLPSSKLQMMTELSQLPDASRPPSSAARLQTARLCPSSLASCVPSARFQMTTELSQLPDASGRRRAQPGTTRGRCDPSARACAQSRGSLQHRSVGWIWNDDGTTARRAGAVLEATPWWSVSV